MKGRKVRKNVRKIRSNSELEKTQVLAYREQHLKELDHEENHPEFKQAASSIGIPIDWAQLRALSPAILARLREAGLDVRETLEGSFSAGSKPNFASKHAFESSRRDLHNALLCTAL